MSGEVVAVKVVDSDSVDNIVEDIVVVEEEVGVGVENVGDVKVEIGVDTDIGEIGVVVDEDKVAVEIGVDVNILELENLDDVDVVVDEICSINLILKLSKPMYVDGKPKSFSNSIVTFF
jgi:hypothetical protein